MAVAFRPEGGVRIGYKLPNCGGVLCPPEWATVETIDAVARLAVGFGFDSLWLHDHLLTPAELSHLDRPAAYEPIVLATHLGALFPQVEIGVATLLLPLRDPVVLAKQLVTTDALLDGRFIAGLGAGRYASEFTAFGSTAFGRRGAVVGEHLEILRRLLSQPEATFAGEFRSVSGAAMWPKPPAGRPRLWVAGQVPAALRRAARYGDGWIGASISAEEVETARGSLLATLQETGRDPSGFTLAVSLTVDPVGAGGREALHTHRQSIGGTTPEIVERLLEYVSAGASHFMLTFPAATVDELEQMMRWFITEVRPQLLAAEANRPVS